MPLNEFSMQENNDEKMSTLQNCNFDIDIEGEPLRTLSSFPREGKIMKFIERLMVKA